MDIFYSTTKHERTDASGKPVQPTESVVLIYGQRTSLKIMTNTDLSAAVCWHSAVGQGNRTETAILCRTVDEEIDSSESRNGILIVPIQTGTAEFLEAVKNGAVRCLFELWGTDSEGNRIECIQFRVIAMPSIDSCGGDPVEIPDDLATKSWVKKIIAGDDAEAFATKSELEKLDEEIQSLNRENGIPAEETDGCEIPIYHDRIVKYRVGNGEEISFSSGHLEQGKCCTMELWLTVGEDSTEFTFSGVTWIREPTFDQGNTMYIIVIRWDGSRVFANIAYTIPAGENE